ncbi:MAG: FliM/FliN family flagellar motor switch protein [Acidimicrobiales bacterium]
MSRVAPKPKLKAWDFRGPEGVDRVAMGAMRAVADGFARSAGARIGSTLRTRTHLSLVGIEQTRWEDFEAASTLPALVASFSFAGPGGPGLVVVSVLPTPLVMALLDLHLAGRGSGPFPARELSEIDRQLIAPFLDLFAQEMAQAVSDTLVPVTASAMTQQAGLHVFQHHGSQSCVVLRFALRVSHAADHEHVFSLCLPVTTLRAVVDPSRPGHGDPERPVPPGVEEAVEALPLALCLRFPPLAVPIEVLENLEPDQVLAVGHPIGRAMSLVAGGRALFGAQPVADGKRASCQIVSVLD